MTMTPDPRTSTSSVTNLRDAFELSLRHGLVEEALASLSPGWGDRFACDFPYFAHDHQTPVLPDDPEPPWTTWLLLGGRGAGKTRAGAEWGRRAVARHGTPIALVGETEHDAREVMIEGISGVMAAHPRHERPVWIPSRRRLQWPSGVFAQAFSAEDPESLRGPQFAAAWCDELAKWKRSSRRSDRAFIRGSPTDS